MSIKYINNNDKVIDNPYLAELDNVIHPVGIVMPWIKHIIPEEVCKGMVDMLDSTGWFIKNIDKSPQEYIDSHRVLDICCRSGNFLRAFYERFNVYLSYKIKNQDKRDYFIWRYLLFGFAGQIREELSKGLTADQENKVADAAIKELRKELYSGFCFYEEDFHGNIYDIQFRPYLDGNNLVWTGKDCPGYTTTFENRAFGKELNEMKFNAVIGNPPYNNDVYIDFVTKGHAIATDYSLWITPAKWQAKGGEKNENFRKNIVPYMSKIVFYPDSKEIFNINMAGGVSYFSVDKAEYTTTHIINKSVKSKAYNNEQHRKVFNCLNNVLMDFLRNNTIKVWHPLTLDVDYFHAKIDSNDSGEITVVSADSSGEFYCLGYCSKNSLTNCGDACKYKVVMCRKQGGATISSDKNGMYLGTNKISILEPNIVTKNEYMILGAFNTLAEAESLKSYLSARLVQFIINASLIGANLTNEESWRFVPDPGAFDRIFVDKPDPKKQPNAKPDEDGNYEYNGQKYCSLYKKYNLTPDEINIIESVIKERK